MSLKLPQPVAKIMDDSDDEPPIIHNLMPRYISTSLLNMISQQAASWQGKTRLPTTAMKSLELLNFGIKEIPTDLTAFTCLEELRISHNKIRSISRPTSSQIFQIIGRSLTLLDLSQNRIEAIPHNFMKLIPLIQTLNLSKNRISSLPSNIGGLTHLRVLQISSNRFRQLPSSLCYLKKNLLVLRIDWPLYLGVEHSSIITDLSQELLLNEICLFPGELNQKEMILSLKNFLRKIGESKGFGYYLETFLKDYNRSGSIEINPSKIGLSIIAEDIGALQNILRNNPRFLHLRCENHEYYMQEKSKLKNVVDRIGLTSMGVGNRQVQKHNIPKSSICKNLFTPKDTSLVRMIIENGKLHSLEALISIFGPRKR